MRKIFDDRPDLKEHLAELNPSSWDQRSETFCAAIDGTLFDGEIVSLGFGAPHVILHTRRIELALMESSDYEGEQDGSDPFEAAGWFYRTDSDQTWKGPNADTSSYYATAADALAAARNACRYR